MADLSGTWLGTFWQAGNPTRFELVLVQGGNSLSGRVLDDGYLGEARVSGEVVGRRVSFVKRYFTTSLQPVDYTGTVSEDEDYLQGQWSIGLIYTGPWEARRGGETLSLEVGNAAKEKVPSLVGAPADSLTNSLAKL